jgi:hypothetical protein
MNDFVLLAEERSGGIVAAALAQTLGLGARAQCIVHEGKSHLERSIPRKIGSWQAPGPTRFVVMRDNDGADCFARKAALKKLIPKVALNRVKIRLVMQELESWYLGDPQALREAGLIDALLARSWSKKQKYRNPDAIRHAKEEFRRSVGERGQTELARLIGPHLAPDRNHSASFHAFVGALRWAAA